MFVKKNTRRARRVGIKDARAAKLLPVLNRIKIVIGWLEGGIRKKTRHQINEDVASSVVALKLIRDELDEEERHKLSHPIQGVLSAWATVLVFLYMIPDICYHLWVLLSAIN